MSCQTRNPYAKSCVRYSNAATQALAAATPTTLILAGTPAVDSGCSLCVRGSGIIVNKPGLYHFSADVTVNPTAAGTVVVQLFKDGVAVPSAVGRDTAETGNIFTIHIETDLEVGACCVNKPTFTVVVSGVAGNVINVSAGALKLA